MALGDTPSWINVRPTDYLQATEAGARAGISVAELRQQAMARAAQMAEARARAQQQAWEFNERMRQEAAQQAALERYREQQLAQQGELRRDELEQRKQYQSGMLDFRGQQAQLAAEKAAQQAAHQGELLGLRGQNYDLARERFGEQQRQFEEMQRLREAAAANKMNPTDYDTVTETIPGTAGSPAIPAEKRSLLGIDWLKSDLPAVEEIPGTPSKTITRRIPIKPSEGTVAPKEPDADLKSQAQAAIAAGAPESAVRKRYKEMTGEDLD